MSASIVAVIVTVLLVALLGVANLWVLRTRSSDIKTLDEFLAVRHWRRVTVRRGLLHVWDRELGRISCSALLAVSRFSRIFVLVVQAEDGARTRLRIAIDPRRHPPEPIILRQDSHW
jgi:hypothetical protein